LQDGQHDFDFLIGAWKIHTRLLMHPPTGSKDWADLNGTVHIRKVWDGPAQLEKIEADGSIGHFEGLTLCLYNPHAHQWSQYCSASAAGVLNQHQPLIGGFRNGRGDGLLSQGQSTARANEFLFTQVTKENCNGSDGSDLPDTEERLGI
jgi:hypothetical protein